MRDAGFLVSPNSTTALSTTWASVKLTAVAASFSNSRATPACAFLGDVEIDLADVSGAASVQATITYDSGGIIALAGPTASSTFAVLDSGRGTIAFAIDKVKTWPAGQTVGECYLWLRLDAGTANLAAAGARLQWQDPRP